jgi:hypothetical protein
MKKILEKFFFDFFIIWKSFQKKNWVLIFFMNFRILCFFILVFFILYFFFFEQKQKKQK